MVRRRQRERSLFEVLLPDGHKLWPDWLRRIDTLLEDEAVIEVVAQAPETRFSLSQSRSGVIWTGPTGSDAPHAVPNTATNVGREE